MTVPAYSPKPDPAVSPVQRLDVAERALLGRLLQVGNRGKSQNEYERVSDLEPRDFAKPSHGRIWAAMKVIAARQEVINSTTVEDEMSKSLGRAINEVGAAYLHGLTEGRYGDVEASAKIIRKASWKRQFKASIRDLDTLSDNEDLSEDQIMEKTAREVERITQQALALTGQTGITLHESVAQLRTRVQIGMQAREMGGELLYMGIMSGLHAIDEVTNGFLPGEVTVISGPTGMGKSALAIKIAKHAMQNGNRVCFVPLEMSHLQMTQRLMAIETQISGTAIKTANIPLEIMPRFMEACQRIQALESSHQFTYLQLDPRPNIQQLKVKLLAHITLYSPQIVIVDQVSIEAMSGTRGNLDEKEVIREIMVELKAMAEKHHIHFLIIAQLNRAGSGQEGQRPTLNNLASSSSVEKAANTVIIVHRPHAQEQMSVEPVEFIFAKNRDGWKGIKTANFIPSLTDYVDVQS